MANPLTRDARGYESQFATNHLGHFQLTSRLMPALQQAQGARVIAVSSLGHRYSPVVFEDPNFERRAYEPWSGYGQSKTANVLFAVELDKLGQKDGIRAFSLHPGAIVDTGLQKYMSLEALRSAGVLDENNQPIRDPSRNLKITEQGAAVLVWTATSPRLNGLGGLYCENCDVAPMMVGDVTKTNSSESRKLTGVLPYAIDPDGAQKLWKLSEQLVFGSR